MAKQPHIIIFNPDEMRGDALAHLGNPASITPNLDAFAAHEAVSFGQAYCQNPVCVPSRCSFFYRPVSPCARPPHHEPPAAPR
ncbi:MAG: hypothetical protein ACLS45_02885 [Subdoligranulum sp.]